MRKNAAEKLLALMDGERQAIMKGDFSELDKFATQKIALFDALNDSRPSSDQLHAIQFSLRHNEALLSAAISGVSAARTRLAALREVKDELRVYTAQGHMAPAPIARKGMNKRS